MAREIKLPPGRIVITHERKMAARPKWVNILLDLVVIAILGLFIYWVVW